MSSVAVTGASGYLGSSLVRRLQADGHECVSLGRSESPDAPEHRHLELGRPVAAGTWRDVDVLVHCAWDLSATSATEVYERNVVGSVSLLRSAAAAAVPRIVFLSSMSAYPGTRQLYGRSKLSVEREVDELGGVSLRPGLVWARETGAMARAVQKLCALPVVPVLGARSYQYTVHRDDVDAAVSLAVTDPTVTGALGVAHPHRVPLPSLLTGLAALGDGRLGKLVTVPWQPVYWAMRAAEAMHVPLSVRAESVLGLVRAAPEAPGVERWAERGLSFAPFPD